MSDEVHSLSEKEALLDQLYRFNNVVTSTKAEEIHGIPTDIITTLYTKLFELVHLSK